MSVTEDIFVEIEGLLDILSNRIVHPLGILAPKLSVMSWRLKIISNAINNITLNSEIFPALDFVSDKMFVTCPKKFALTSSSSSS